MTHVFALATLLGRPGAAELVDHGVRALTENFRDREHDGWFASISATTIRSRYRSNMCASPVSTTS